MGVKVANEKYETSEATVGQIPDQFGQVHPVETPELIKRKLIEFEEELNKLPTARLESLKLAQEKCPHLLTDEFKLQFLRADVFNADHAASRYAKHWDVRIDICGPEKAFLPFTSTGASKDDDVALTMGFVQVVPNVTDATGRPIVYFNPANQGDKIQYKPESLARAVWYMCHALLEESEEAQKYGIHWIVWSGDVRFRHFDQALVRRVLPTILDCMPFRLTACHICKPPFFFKFAMAFIGFFCNAYQLSKVRSYYGSLEGIFKELAGLGLDKDILPTEMDGKVTLDPKSWLDQQRKLDK